jgi:hypothetical protein
VLDPAQDDTLPPMIKEPLLILHGQPSLKDPARKLWEAILGSRHFGPAKVVKEVGRESSWHSTARAKKKRLTVMWPSRVQERSKTASKGAQNGSYCPGNERCAVEAACPFCYLRDSGLYVHESCCLGNERHPLTYVGCRRFWYGPLTKYGS